LLNHPNFSLPNAYAPDPKNGAPNPAFGTISSTISSPSAAGSRELQFALRLAF
jgi:hypothetical protein